MFFFIKTHCTPTFGAKPLVCVENKFCLLEKDKSCRLGLIYTIFCLVVSLLNSTVFELQFLVKLLTAFVVKYLLRKCDIARRLAVKLNPSLIRETDFTRRSRISSTK